MLISPGTFSHPTSGGIPIDASSKIKLTPNHEISAGSAAIAETGMIRACHEGRTRASNPNPHTSHEHKYRPF
jgi:hypothetical protein